MKLRKFTRWIAIRTGGYPEFVLKRFRSYILYVALIKCGDDMIDAIFCENPGIKWLSKKGCVKGDFEDEV